MQYVSVGIGGMLGAVLRAILGLAIPMQAVAGFPLATLLINWLGTFSLAWLTGQWLKRSTPAWLVTGLRVGLLGSFTTFSTFSYEMLALLQAERWWFAMSYAVLSLCGGLIFVWLGERAAMYRWQVGS